jgi:hypothetical protein
MNWTYTPEECDKRVKYYFKDCEETRKVFPDEAGMLNYLDIEDEEYEAMKEDENYKKIFRWALRRRRSWLERAMVSDNKKANGSMNALKQPQNGGYSDRPIENKERKLIVKLEGIE